MADKNWHQEFIANPATKLRASDILYTLRQGSPNIDVAGEWGVLSNFENIIFIANNGDDTNGNGSQLCPLLTGPAAEAIAIAAAPSATNEFLILDQRVGLINEPVTFIPFVNRLGNKLAELNGNWTMHSSFSSISTDTFSGIANYKSLGITTPGTVNFNFSALSTAHAIIITLSNFEKALYTGSYVGNDAANLGVDTFRINEYSFNTGFQNSDGSYSRSDIALSSGLTRRIRNCEGWQSSSITKSLGSVPCATFLDVAFCGNAFFQNSTNTLALISSGGANNQPFVNINVLCCITGDSVLLLDITNDGASNVSIQTDITTGYFINSANSLTNISFDNFSLVDHQSSDFFPMNYTRTSYDDSGFNVTMNMLGSQLNGIDIAIQQVPALQGNNISNLNNGIGYGAFAANITGANNSWCGMWCFKNGTDLQLNTALGFNAGSAYIGSERRNICIGAQGIAGDFQTTRIGYLNSNGTTSTQLKCFIDGIYQATSSLGRSVVVDSTGQIYQVTNPLTVTQATSINTGVTLNSRTGVITTVSTTLAALTATSFVLTNSQISSTSGINAFLMGYSGTLITAGVPYIFASAPVSGSCTINIVNLNALAALNGLITIGFEIV